MKTVWVLVILLNGEPIEDQAYFETPESCLRVQQNLTKSVILTNRAGCKNYYQAFCLPKNLNKRQ